MKRNAGLKWIKMALLHFKTSSLEFDESCRYNGERNVLVATVPTNN